MPQPRHIAVIDIGKTNAKVVLFDAAAGCEIASLGRRNTPLQGEYSHFDVDGLWSFIRLSLAQLNLQHPVDAISITTHGACFAMLDEDGSLALPVMDYEDPAPDALNAVYRTVRPPFAETGSPRLPMGLNAGAMIYWQAARYPEAFARVRWIVPWPQYWAYRLTGEIASEVTSLGVHTDLWNPHQGRFSTMVERMDWLRLMPPIRPAEAVLGPILPELARETGLATGTPVHGGIHDSNASLLPHLLSRPAPFSVLSTGTWVVTLSVGGREVTLDETRDVLINVNARGMKTPSARFMGGRAFEMLVPQGTAVVTEEDRRRVLAARVMVLPSWPPGSGPFPDAAGSWTAQPRTQGERLYAVSLYLALMANVTRQLTGAQGDVIVEGPFAANRDFLDMLASLCGRKPIVSSGQATGTSFGAACLALGASALQETAGACEVVTPDPALAAYAERWHELTGS